MLDLEFVVLTTLNYIVTFILLFMIYELCISKKGKR